MDGVLIHEGSPIPGADEFIRRLRELGRPFLVLTNNSIYTPRDLRARLAHTGIDLPEAAIWTSALATAQFLRRQRPGGSAYVIGEAGLTTALHEAGYMLTDNDPDYVVLGETRNYSFEAITRAIRLINDGARFICTNPDATGPSLEGALPAAGSVAALITKATGIEPYFVGKPNPLMMREALNKIEAHSETSAMVGDRMDTDVLGGLEAGLRTFLVLTGVTQAGRGGPLPLPYRRTVVASIADLIPYVDLSGTAHGVRHPPGADRDCDRVVRRRRRDLDDRQPLRQALLGRVGLVGEQAEGEPVVTGITSSVVAVSAVICAAHSSGVGLVAVGTAPAVRSTCSESGPTQLLDVELVPGQVPDRHLVDVDVDRCARAGRRRHLELRPDEFGDERRAPAHGRGRLRGRGPGAW